MKDIMSVVVFPANHLSKARYSIFVMKMPLTAISQLICVCVGGVQPAEERGRQEDSAGERAGHGAAVCRI